MSPHAERYSDTGVVNPLDPTRRVRAVLFDVDGTLYRQGPVRVSMAFELALLAVHAPRSAPRIWKALRSYRQAHEELRLASGRLATNSEQVVRAAQLTGLPATEIQDAVDEWMIRRPLRHLRRSSARGLPLLLAELRAAHIPVGVLSDYPVADKLAGLGLAEMFDPAWCTSAPHIGAMKPDPRGFLRVCAYWRLAPGEVLMVGDRPDVDAAGAHAAGMPCVIVTHTSRAPRREATHLAVSSLEALATLVRPPVFRNAP